MMLSLRLLLGVVRVTYAYCSATFFCCSIFCIIAACSAPPDYYYDESEEVRTLQRLRAFLTHHFAQIN
jgi:hypothetical protein